MVSYGPWRQDPDYDQSHSLSELSGDDPTDGLPLFDYAKTSSSVATEFQDPAYPIIVGDLGGVVGAVATPGPEGGGSTLALTLWGIYYGWGYNLSVPNWQSVWAAESAHRACRIVPITPFYNPPNQGIIPPVAAIGIDFTNAPYDPEDPWSSAAGEILSRAISPNSILRGVWHDDETTGGVPGSPTEIMLLPSGGLDAVLLEVIEPPPTPNGSDLTPQTVAVPTIDLTPYLDDTWSGTIWTRQVPPFVPPTRDPSDIGSTGEVRYGWGFERLWIVTMVRPPLYRWVYATMPHRRTFPNDATTEGARRTFPPSRAIQSSNRTSGGFL